ncbi:MAG: DUF1566 domain-containing protein [Myxococcota bacterium]|jgi:hypothetical protein|nr:DUF1566 domain-containing protein [Myxococcota bacterium]
MTRFLAFACTAALLTACSLDFERQPLSPADSSYDGEQSELDTELLAELPDEGELDVPDQDLPDQDLPDQDLPDQELPDEDQELPDEDELEEQTELPPSCENLGCPSGCCEDSDGPRCVELSSDAEHCGFCGNGCNGLPCFEGNCCTPMTCAELGAECGELGDGCGGTLSCGSCEAPESCALLRPNRCDSPYRIPDTATVYCYGDEGCPDEGEQGYGQDGSYVLFSPIYTVSGLTATEHHLGLTWQLEDENGGMSFGAATAYCDALSYDGRSDWRLPNFFELVTLLDLGTSSEPRTLPLFAELDRSRLFSSSPFDSGYLTVNLRNASTESITGTAHAICVAGPELEPAFVAHSGWVEDRRFALGWTDTVVGSSGWFSALAACEALERGGLSDWRLPNLAELISILRFDGGPLFDPSYFSIGGSDRYFRTSSPVGPGSTSLISFDIGDGKLSASAPGAYQNPFLCVRSTDDDPL